MKKIEPYVDRPGGDLRRLRVGQQGAEVGDEVGWLSLRLAFAWRHTNAKPNTELFQGQHANRIADLRALAAQLALGGQLDRETARAVH
jgi:hypothetical protein